MITSIASPLRSPIALATLVAVLGAHAASAELSAPWQADTTDWYEFTATGTTEPGEIGLGYWLEKPAGKHGRVTRQGDSLYYNGEPIRFWGHNLISKDVNALDNETTPVFADHLAKYGINLVRPHKFMEVWSKQHTDDSSYELDPTGMAQFDDMVYHFKQAGIYLNLSPSWHLAIKEQDKQEIPYWEEFAMSYGTVDHPIRPHVKTTNGFGSVPGFVYFLEEFQNIRIKQLENLLEHTNYRTGVRYADEPAIAFVELNNESSIGWLNSYLENAWMVTLRDRASTQFCNWLRNRYPTHADLLAAWGESGLAHKSDIADNPNTSWPEAGFPNQNLDDNNIPPLVMSDSLLDSSDPGIRQRALDTNRFLYDTQRAFYNRFRNRLTDAATGYDGELIASNWTWGAKHGQTHLYNLATDREIGLIDRHEYSALSAATILRAPGSEQLAKAFGTQVADRPMMISEWAQLWSSPSVIESLFINAAYGMGLQGWDAMTHFSNETSFTKTGSLLSPAIQFNQFFNPSLAVTHPFLARQIHRNDVDEGTDLATLPVHLPSLHQNKIAYQLAEGSFTGQAGLTWSYAGTDLLLASDPDHGDKTWSGTAVVLDDAAQGKLSTAAPAAVSTMHIEFKPFFGGLGALRVQVGDQTFDSPVAQDQNDLIQWDFNVIAPAGTPVQIETTPSSGSDWKPVIVDNVRFDTTVTETFEDLTAGTFNSDINGIQWVDPQTGLPVAGTDIDITQTSTLPFYTPAIAKTVVAFEDSFREATPFPVEDFIDHVGTDTTYRATNNQLFWRVGDGQFDADMIVNTPATQGAVGFFEQGELIDLPDVEIRILERNQFAAIYVTASEPDKTLANSDKILVLALGRARNTGMSYDADGNLVTEGTAPVLMEPVRASLRFKRSGTIIATRLDHDGIKEPFGEVGINDQTLSINGVFHQTPYYVVEFSGGGVTPPTSGDNPVVDAAFDGGLTVASGSWMNSNDPAEVGAGWQVQAADGPWTHDAAGGFATNSGRGAPAMAQIIHDKGQTTGLQNVSFRLANQFPGNIVEFYIWGVNEEFGVNLYERVGPRTSAGNIADGGVDGAELLADRDLNDGNDLGDLDEPDFVTVSYDNASGADNRVNFGAGYEYLVVLFYVQGATGDGEYVRVDDVLIGGDAPDPDPDPEPTDTILETFDWADGLDTSLQDNTGTATGADGLLWTYNRAGEEDSKSITGTSLILQRKWSETTTGWIEARLPAAITGFKLKFQPRYGGKSQIRVTVDGVPFNSVIADGHTDLQTMDETVSAPADATIRIESIGNPDGTWKDVVIDDLELLGSGGGGGTPPPGVGTTLQPTDDANSFAGDGTSDTTSPVSQFARFAMKFNLGSVSSVQSATLRVYRRNNDTAANTVEAYAGRTDAWNENSPNADIPIETGGVLDAVNSPGGGQWLAFDVTDLVAAEAAGDGTATLVLRTRTGTWNTFVHTRQNPTNPPELVINGGN